MDKEALKIFDEYTKKYDKKSDKVNWKYYHSIRVSNIIVDIAKSLDLQEKDINLAYLIGLFHDIGRFEQIKIFDSYNDLKTIDHGSLGEKIIRETHILDSLLNNEDLETLLFSIYYHNKKDIAPSSDRNIMFAKMIKDADKIDIMRGEADGSLKIKYDASIISDDVKNYFYSKRLVDRKILTNCNEELLSDISFVYDLNYIYTKKIFYEENIFGNIYNIIDDKYKKIFEEYLVFANKYLEEEVLC